MKTTTRKQYLANNAIVRRLAKKYGIKYSTTFCSYLPNAKRIKLWHCDEIKEKVFNQFASELYQKLVMFRSVEYRGMDPKSVGKWYADFRKNTKSIYVYYK